MKREEERRKRKKRRGRRREAKIKPTRYGTLDFCMELTLIMELNGSMEL